MRAYPVAGKQKSIEICRAFIEGAPEHASGSVFYGVTEANDDYWRKAKLENDYWYIDNSYTDPQRQTYFRVTRNAMQHSGIGVSDGKRFRKLALQIKPWRRAGKHVVVACQSAHFMRLSDYYGDWTADTVTALAKVTNRPVRLRLWSGDKEKSSSTLHNDLEGAHCLVTWSSCAAVTALLAGIPVICTGPSACAPMSGALDDPENLPMPDREKWAAVLADQQFSMDEMRSGKAWAMLNDSL